MRTVSKTSAVILMLLASPGLAADSWWDKAIGIFKSANKSSESAKPSLGEVGDALREALRHAADSVVARLGTTDGFNGDAEIRIQLPEKLRVVREILAKVGLSDLTDSLEQRLNRAAEAAVPRARALFVSAISDMTFEDVQQIYKGGEEAATRYFERQMTPALTAEMRPIIERSLSEVGAVKAYDTVIGKYDAIPFVPDVKANIIDYVTDKSVDGIFVHMAKEEAAIRSDPLRQSTALLKKVFSAVDL